MPKTKLEVVKEPEVDFDQEYAKKLGLLVESWLELEADGAKIREEVNNRVKAAKAAFKDAVEKGRSNDPIEIQNKLEYIERGWQDWEEVQSERIEQNKEIKGKIDGVKKAIRELVANSKQGNLFDDGTSE
jgi:hypothetical protein